MAYKFWRKQMHWYTFKVPVDRGPKAWEQHASETMQLGPHETEGDAWESLEATVGKARADQSAVVGID